MWTAKEREEDQGECGWMISKGGPTKDHTPSARGVHKTGFHEEP